MPRTPAGRGARLRAMVRPVVAWPGGVVRVCRALVIVLSYATAVAAQAPDGSRVFQASCASCHTGAADSRAPGVDALRARTPQAIIDALLIGAMRPQGARLSGAERRAVAEFVTGKSIEGDVSGASSRTLHGAARRCRTLRRRRTGRDGARRPPTRAFNRPSRPVSPHRTYHD